MGKGKFINGKLNFIVTSKYLLTPAERTAVKTDLQNASNFLFRATGGQVQFGDIYLVDESFGVVDAEMLLFNEQGARSAGSRGEFGVPNKFVKINKSDRNDPSVIVHELSHHIWNLGDEYAGPMIRFLINKLVNSPDPFTIPVIQPFVAFNEFVNDRIHLAFNNNSYDRIVESNTSTEILVERNNSPFPDLPTNSSESIGYRQDLDIKCAPDNNTCIMQERGKTLFCSANNHSNVETDQQVQHQMSCWEKIIATTGFETLFIPSSNPINPPPLVNFLDLEKQGRFAIAFDISGSMKGEKLKYTKHGVNYWIDQFSMEDHYLSLIAYNDINNILLPLTKVNNNPNIIPQLKIDVDVLRAEGNTNIRDALIEGVNQITSIPNRSFSQAVLLLTDGKHNRPRGTSLMESLPDLDANGVKVMSIAIGDAGDVIKDDLDDLADITNGDFYPIGLNDMINIETALIEAYAWLTRSLITSDFRDFVPSSPQKKHSTKINKLYKDKKNPTLKDIFKTLETPFRFHNGSLLIPYEDLFKVVDFLVERGCTQTNITINYKSDAEVDLFLITPSHELAVADNINIKKIASTSSNKVIIVNKPKPGIWKIILFAKKLSTTDTKTRVNITVSGKNKVISVWGGADKSFYKGGPVVISANVIYGSAGLSGLDVRAILIPARGKPIEVKLNDGGFLSPDSGRYKVELDVKRGKYKGLIHIECESEAILADGLHAITHAPANVNSFDLSVKTGKFKRVIPFYFQKS